MENNQQDPAKWTIKVSGNGLKMNGQERDFLNTALIN
jgi:hypothetical protein